MKNYCIPAELLYIISVYEKGRISSKKIWIKRYINSLKDSIDVMNLLVSVMKSKRKLTDVEFQRLYNYINKNMIKSFPNGANQKIFEAYKSGMLFQFEVDKAGYELLQLMEINLNKCKALLKKGKKNYKIKISYLLWAVHNIPRYFLSEAGESFLGLPIVKITAECIKDSVYDYMRLSERI